MSSDVKTNVGLRMLEHFRELRRNGALSGDPNEIAVRWEEACENAITGTAVSELSFGSSGGFDGGTGTEQNTTPLKHAAPAVR